MSDTKAPVKNVDIQTAHTTGGIYDVHIFVDGNGPFRVRGLEEERARHLVTALRTQRGWVERWWAIWDALQETHEILDDDHHFTGVRVMAAKDKLADICTLMRETGVLGPEEGDRFWCMACNTRFLVTMTPPAEPLEDAVCPYCGSVDTEHGWPCPACNGTGTDPIHPAGLACGLCDGGLVR